MGSLGGQLKHGKPPTRPQKWRAASRAPIKVCSEYQSKTTAPAAQTEVHVRNALVYSLLWKSSGGRATCATLRVIREALCASSFPYSLLLSLGLAISSKHPRQASTPQDVLVLLRSAQNPSEIRQAVRTYAFLQRSAGLMAELTPSALHFSSHHCPPTARRLPPCLRSFARPRVR